MKKKYVLVTLNSKWKWLLDLSSPQKYNFTSIDGMKFINPLYYKNYLKLSQFSTFDKIGNNVLIQSDTLLFEFNSEQNYEKSSNNNEIPKFFKYIRFVSNQVSIDFTNSMTMITYPSEKLKLSIVEIENRYKKKYNNRYVSNLIKWEHVKKANQLIKNKYTIPIYEDILLDALDGFYKNDSRKTIIYSAIAIESMMAIKLDEHYENKLNSSKKNNLRIVEIPTHNGMVKKDPVFQKLCKNTNFSSLLHERCLYILNKSLFIDNQSLYKSALSLYSTRNKIVHLGEPNENSNQYLEIDRNGAMVAYNIAVEIFEWMGIKNYEKVVPLSFVDLE